jgi:hypothetical protein
MDSFANPEQRKVADRKKFSQMLVAFSGPLVCDYEARAEK